ncbi:MAG: hypothetical protein MN733_20560, partial [Nitrososphaera sp.]|nr:hypothetical protein [Nitrososphaera sp.]
EHNVLALHGGVFPAFFQKHPDGFHAVEAKTSWQTGGGKLMDRARRFLRVRYVNSQGDMISLGENKLSDPFWADVYDGRVGTIVYGHSPFSDVRRTAHTIGIDTGCVTGGNLTAFVIPESGLANGYTVSVPAARQYTQPFQED